MMHMACVARVRLLLRARGQSTVDTTGKNRVPAYDPTLRRITLTGQWLLTLTVILFATMGVLWPEPYAKVWQLVLAHIVGGRPGNVLVGIKLGFSLPFIYLQCVLEDLIIMFLFYPLLVFGYRHAIEWRVLGPALVTIRQTAHRHKSKVEPYGVAGLMFFVIFPFWSTGALAAAFVGYLIGMRTSVTFVSVTIGNFIAVALWVWLFNEINQFSGQLAQGMLVVIFGTVIVGALVTQLRSLTRARRELSQSTAPEKTDEDDAPHDE